jgi:hypothetical protein
MIATLMTSGEGRVVESMSRMIVKQAWNNCQIR